MSPGAPAVEETASPAVLPPLIARFSVRLAPDRPWPELAASIPPELSKAVPSRQRQFAAGRYCAERALTAAGFPSGSRPGRQPGGAPAWPPGSTGSITHTHRFASAAVAPTTLALAIGLDSEDVVSDERARRIAPAVLGSGELERAETGGISFAEWVTAAFCAKEALYKLLHPLVGVFFYHPAASVLTLDPDAGSFRIRLEAELSDRFGPGLEFSGGLVLRDGQVHTGLWLPA